MVSLVPLGALAALGGAYPSSAVPLLIAATVAFLVCGGRVGATAETRRLDLALTAFAGGILLQMAPLPAALAAILSPQSASLQDMLQLDAPGAVRSLSIDAGLTRTALASATASILLFWAARETFSLGGVRAATRTVAWVGFAVTLVALAQRATAPAQLLWMWKPLDPGAQPFGPFVNRNHFATWLLLAASLTGGYLVTHLRSRGLDRASRRLLVHDLLADGRSLLLSGALAMMVLGLAASLSRAAIIAGATALTVGLWFARRRGSGSRGVRAGAFAVLVLLGAAAWTNRDAIVRKFDSAALVGRPTVWRETMPLVHDFGLTGAGVGTYAQAMLRYQQTRGAAHFNQAHNEYLQLVAEGGILLAVPAVIAAAAWVGLARRRLFSGGQNDGEIWVRIGAAAGIAGLAVQSLFETGLRMPANTLLFALLAAIVVHQPKILDSTELRARCSPGVGQ